MKKTKFLRKNFLNAPRGITLMVLIITIIIMLILAGVVLNLGAGDDGIFSSAEKAVSETTVAMAREETELMLAKWVIQYHKEGLASQTAAEYVEEKLGEGTTTSSGKFFVTVKDEMVRVYEGAEANEENKVTLGKMASSGGIEWLKFVKLPSELNVGDYVTYSPSGTYNWAAEYASSDLTNDGSADVALATGTEVTADTQDMSITSWRVLSIDEITGKVELVPSLYSKGKVRLQGAQGYNNGVKLLNDACSSLYGNSEKAISARSINIEDIESRMTDEALAEAHSYVNTDSNTTWGKQVTSAYTVNRQYPTIYAKENLSVIDGVKNTTGLGRSEQTALIGRTEEEATNGKLKASISIQPYQTYWRKGNIFMQTAFKGEGNGTSNINYKLLFPDGTKSAHWVASRCVNASSTSCAYYVINISVGGLDWRQFDTSGTGGYAPEERLFPVVSLNVNLISGNDTDGWKVE